MVKTCGDCIHADVCKEVNGGWFSPKNPAYCKLFKNKDVPSKWISVEDRLPTKEDADKVGHVMAIIKGDDFAQIFSWSTVAINPRGFTSWMPIPKEVANE